MVNNTMLEVDNLSCHFGGLKAVNNVSMTVDAGDMLAVIGPNGAGKTTLFNLLTGQVTPTAGTVLLKNERIERKAPQARARLGLGRTFQIVKPFPSLSVVENVMIGAFQRTRKRADAEDRARQVLERVELAHRADALGSELSLGQRKRLELARALATEPHVLLLDEVMAGLNPTEVERAIILIQRLHRDGLTIVLIEHNLKVVRSLAKAVVVLDHGVVISRGQASEVLEDPKVVEAYLGKRRR